MLLWSLVLQNVTRLYTGYIQQSIRKQSISKIGVTEINHNKFLCTQLQLFVLQRNVVLLCTNSKHAVITHMKRHNNTLFYLHHWCCSRVKSAWYNSRLVFGKTTHAKTHKENMHASGSSIGTRAKTAECRSNFLCD